LHWSVGHDATVAQRIVSDAIAAPLSTSIGGPRPSWPVGRGRPRWCARSSWPEPRASATPGKTRSTPLRLAFHVNKIPISAAIEGRGAQDMVALVLHKSRPDSCIEPHTGEKGGGHVEQHEEQRNREG